MSVPSIVHQQANEDFTMKSINSEPPSLSDEEMGSPLQELGPDCFLHGSAKARMFKHAPEPFLQRAASVQPFTLMPIKVPEDRNSSSGVALTDE